MPEISIIIPCHNVSQYLHRCFQSLCNQTLEKHLFELIFIDDASTDDTWNILMQLEASEPELVSIVHLDENQRQGGARNIGLYYARGNYIGYVDSDDWVEPDMYETLYNAITGTDYDLIFCRHLRDDGTGNLYLSPEENNPCDIPRVITLDTPAKHSEFVATNAIGCSVWDKLFRKDFLTENNITFPAHLAYEDIYFSSLVYLYAKKVCVLERKLYHYFVNTDSTVLKKNSDYHRDIFQINQLKWEAYQQRSIPETLRAAFEFDFIMTFYFTGIKILCLRFDEFYYDDFMVLKKGILERIPNYRNNPYLKTHIPDFYKPLLTLLDYPVTQNDLSRVRNAFLTYHKMN